MRNGDIDEGDQGAVAKTAKEEAQDETQDETAEAMISERETAELVRRALEAMPTVTVAGRPGLVGDWVLCVYPNCDGGYATGYCHVECRSGCQPTRLSRCWQMRDCRGGRAGND
jgi:hypothetical protein